MGNVLGVGGWVGREITWEPHGNILVTLEKKKKQKIGRCRKSDDRPMKIELDLFGKTRFNYIYLEKLNLTTFVWQNQI
jgi:hypothetical protein